MHALLFILFTTICPFVFTFLVALFVWTVNTCILWYLLGLFYRFFNQEMLNCVNTFYICIHNLTTVFLSSLLIILNSNLVVVSWRHMLQRWYPRTARYRSTQWTIRSLWCQYKYAGVATSVINVDLNVIKYIFSLYFRSVGENLVPEQTHEGKASAAWRRASTWLLFTDWWRGCLTVSSPRYLSTTLFHCPVHSSHRP